MTLARGWVYVGPCAGRYRKSECSVRGADRYHIDSWLSSTCAGFFPGVIPTTVRCLAMSRGNGTRDFRVSLIGEGLLFDDRALL